jgi:hypothetical protein
MTNLIHHPGTYHQSRSIIPTLSKMVIGLGLGGWNYYLVPVIHFEHLNSNPSTISTHGPE